MPVCGSFWLGWRAGGEDIPINGSYRIAARHLAHLIEERKEQFDRPTASGKRKSPAALTTK